MALKRKTKSKIFFLLIFSINFLILVAPGKAETRIATPTVTVDHLLLTSGDFVHTVSDPDQNQIHVNLGGVDLSDFVNLGMVSYDEVNNQILYKAKTRFSGEITIHTTADIQNIDSDFSVNQITDHTYLSVDKYTWIFDPARTTHNYKVSYSEVEFDIENSHDYNGYYPITVGIKNTKGFSGELILGDSKFEMPELQYDVMSVKILDKRWGDIGNKEDYLIDFNGNYEGKLTIEEVTQQNANEKVLNFINNADIGWKTGVSTGPITIQNYKIGGPQIGSLMNDMDPSADAFTFHLNTLMRPQITQTKQFYSLTSASIWWDNLDTWLFSPAGMGFYWGPTQKSYSRITSVTAKNFFVWYDFSTDIDLYMTVQPDHILSESELQDPFYEQGDWIWDTTFMGDVPTLPEDTGEWDLLGGIFDIMWMLIIAFAVVVFLIVYFKRSMLRRD